MILKFDACQGYFTSPDPLYRLNDSPPLNAREIGQGPALLQKGLEYKALPPHHKGS